MRVHRFYIGQKVSLTHNLWIHDVHLLHQWLKVLRFNPGQQVVLFDGVEYERLYKITEIKDDEICLDLVTDYARSLPKKEIYLFWGLLKKDKNDWLIQKCTELGVKHFVPLLADRSEKTGFNMERAQKIIIEAVEQCGRSDLPSVREPLSVASAIEHYKDKTMLVVGDQGGGTDIPSNLHSIGVLVGPEGGWSEEERRLFESSGLNSLGLHDFTLRAETACVVSVAKLIQ